MQQQSPQMMMQQQPQMMMQTPLMQPVMMVQSPMKIIPQMGSGSWAHDTFSCFGDFGTCMMACCCTPCQHGQNKEMLDGSGCFGACCMFFCISLVGCGPCYAGSFREQVRVRNGIMGGCCGDCCIHLFCTMTSLLACAMTQEKRQIDWMKQHNMC